MKTVLFDMDGTITEPRQKIDWPMVASLRDLAAHTKIGIVTGSDYDYIMQQCNLLFDIGGIDPARVQLLPCNGTKHYVWHHHQYEKIYEANMIDEIGTEVYSKLLRFICGKQLEIMNMFPQLPYTGTFVQYRGSMLNWCPIGRQADNEKRQAWQTVDSSKNIRVSFVKEIQDWCAKANIKMTVALGGSTSFDLYPNGWDKTFALRHLNPSLCYFIGDKCTGSGNDRQIYEKIKLDGVGAYEVKSVEETLKVINEIILGEKNE